MGNYVSDKKNAKHYPLKFSRTRDADIIARLDNVVNRQAYIKRLIRADLAARRPDIESYIDDYLTENGLKKGEETMKSVYHQASELTPEEAIARFGWEQIVQFMDNSTVEAVHDELAPCAQLAFLRRYLELAPEDLILP